MKHRALSMLLALVMVVSLLPIAAIANGAEENTAAEERKETVEMRENDSQQGGDGEKSQLPTEENEKTAIQLYVEKKGGATSYTRYQYDENVRLPWLVYVNESDNAVVPAFLTFFQSKAECYAIQKAADGTRTKFGQIEIHTNAEGLFALWKDFPKDLNWSEAEKADYVLMFHCNGRWYKFNAQLRAGSAPLVGELVLQYNGTNYSGEDGMILPAGVHQVALTLQTQNGRKMITSGENLEWDNTIITGLNPIDDNGLWRIVLAEPTGKQATGYIEYTDGERHTSRVNITCTRSYGDEVTGEVISTVSRQLVARLSSARDNLLFKPYQNGSKTPENQGFPGFYCI